MSVGQKILKHRAILINQREHTFEKLGVETRTAAANLAIGKIRGS